MPADVLTQNRYQILRRLHVGGMGEVFLAQQSGTLRRKVVLKRMLPGLRGDPSLQKRFAQEAALLSDLAGPGLPALYETGEGGEGPFLVLQYIEGANLRELLLAGGPLSFAQAAHVLGRSFSILARLQEAKDAQGASLGFVHRDLAPENLQLSLSAQVYLLDLGIARSAASRLRTEAGVRQGRISYMAPEVLRGEAAGAASDVFSLALVGAELVGALESVGEATPALLERLGREGAAHRLRWPGEIPGSFRRLLEPALELDPSRRPAARALAESFAALAGAAGLEERAAQAQQAAGTQGVTPVLAGKNAPRRPWIAWAALAAMIGAALAAALGISSKSSPPPPAMALAPPLSGELVRVRLHAGAPGTFSLILDGRDLGTLSGSREFEIPPGAHTAVLTQDSAARYYREDFLLESGKEREIFLPLDAPATREGAP